MLFMRQASCPAWPQRANQAREVCETLCRTGAMVALGLAPLSLGFMVSPLMASWVTWLLDRLLLSSFCCFEVYQHLGFQMVPVVAGAMLPLGRDISEFPFEVLHGSCHRKLRGSKR